MFLLSVKISRLGCFCCAGSVSFFVCVLYIENLGCLGCAHVLFELLLRCEIKAFFQSINWLLTLYNVDGVNECFSYKIVACVVSYPHYTFMSLFSMNQIYGRLRCMISFE